MYSIQMAYTPEELIIEASQLHDISGYVRGVDDCYITISQSFQITHYVVNGLLRSYPREYLNDFTMVIENCHGCADEVEGTASELLQYLHDLQRYAHASY